MVDPVCLVVKPGEQFEQESSHLTLLWVPTGQLVQRLVDGFLYCPGAVQFSINLQTQYKLSKSQNKMDLSLNQILHFKKKKKALKSRLRVQMKRVFRIGFCDESFHSLTEHAVTLVARSPGVMNSTGHI